MRFGSFAKHFDLNYLTQFASNGHTALSKHLTKRRLFWSPSPSDEENETGDELAISSYAGSKHQHFSIPRPTPPGSTGW